jgi:hypothetical protein
MYIYSSSQNLVPNASFESHFDCSYIGIESSSPWCGVNPVGYLNSCMSGSLSVPTQYFSPGYPSYQVPHSGNAYASYAHLYAITTAQPRYPHVPLIDTLKTGKTYCVTYYVSLWNDCKYSTDKFGALFTATPFNCTVTNQTLTTGYTPQVVSPAGYLYNDTLNWQEVSGTFIADGTEAYLTIGNFYTNAQHTITLSYPSGVRNVLEYYLDDVSVEEVEIAKAKNDTLIYATDSVVIGKNASEAALFSWQPTTGLSCINCPNPKASPTITTTYTVTKTQCKSVTSDVITVTVSPVGINEVGMPNVESRILPNPASDLVTVTSRYDFEKIELLSITGQVLLTETVNSKSHQLQLQNFAEGIYFIRITYPNGLINTKKLMVQH